MNKYTIEVCGVPVAIVVVRDEATVHSFIEGHTSAGREFRQDLTYVVAKSTGQPLWEGSQLVARLCNSAELDNFYRQYPVIAEGEPEYPFLSWIFSPVADELREPIYVFQPYAEDSRVRAVEALLAQYSQ